MVHCTEYAVEKAQLPRLLPKLLLKLHLVKVSTAVALIVLAVVMMSLFSMANVVLLGAAVISLMAGIMGLLANRLKSLVLHGGAAVVLLLSCYMSLLPCVVYYTGIGLATEQREIAMLLMCLLGLLLDLVFSALNAGVELVVIYVADCTRRQAMKDMLLGRTTQEGA